MNILWYIVPLVVLTGVFFYLLREGYFLRVSTYWRETMEELKKCTWPTWEELKGSTVLVTLCIVLLGGFTVAVDYVAAGLITYLVSI